MVSTLRPHTWPGDHALFRSLGMVVDSFDQGEAIVSARCDEAFGNQGGATLHGGTYGAFGACAAEVAAATLLEEGLEASFVEYRVQIFRPLAPGDIVRCHARILHRGRRYLGVLVEVNRDDGKTCALFTGTIAPRPATPSRPGALEEAPPPELAPAKYPYEAASSWGTFGVRVTGTGEGFGVVSSAGDSRFIGLGGEAHPSFVAAVADSVTVPACFTVVSPGEWFTTLEYKVNFLHPVTAPSGQKAPLSERTTVPSPSQ